MSIRSKHYFYTFSFTKKELSHLSVLVSNFGVTFHFSVATYFRSYI